MSILEPIRKPVRDMIRKWLEPKFLDSETCIIEPGSHVEIDKHSNTSGSYAIYVDLSGMSNIDNLSIQVYIKPGVDCGELLYLTSSPRHTDESLWYLNVPPCAGFKIRYTLATGKNLKIVTSIWRK